MFNKSTVEGILGLIPGTRYKVKFLDCTAQRYWHFGIEFLHSWWSAPFKLVDEEGDDHHQLIPCHQFPDAAPVPNTERHEASMAFQLAILFEKPLGPKLIRFLPILWIMVHGPKVVDNNGAFW